MKISETTKNFKNTVKNTANKAGEKAFVVAAKSTIPRGCCGDVVNLSTKTSQIATKSTFWQKAKNIFKK